MKWLSAYGSLDGVMANADKITGVVGENLRKALDWLPQGRVLVTVKTDCDLSEHMKSILESLTMQPVDKEVLKDLFTRY
ncbi:hypothetical protein ABTH91_20770, partial [Acinetobacter baumannii]